MSQRDNVIDKKYKNAWQYHSRSDHHSKVTCLAILCDLLLNCPALRAHADRENIGFGINHRMVDFRQNKHKDLDLVICTRGTPAGSVGRKALSFKSLMEHYRLVIPSIFKSDIDNLPDLKSVPVGSVHLALESKAAMTAHSKACPRLFDELNSSHAIVHGHSSTTIAAGLVMINVSDSFISPDMNKEHLAASDPYVNRHRQPGDAAKVLLTVTNLPRRSDTASVGFDALAALLIDCKNDGSPVSIFSKPPSPQPGDALHYDECVRRICSTYASRFPLP
jgi:hypothetical protein